MATPGQVTKIYQLKTLGYDQITKELDVINKKFDQIKKTKLAAEGKLINAQDISEVEKYSKEVAELVVEEQRLRVERQQMMNEQKAANIRRQEEIRLQKEKLKGNQAETGSIVELRNRIKELNALVIRKDQKGSGIVNFEGQNLSVDQAIAKLKELIATEQEFRRQFAKDSTLVGEYTTGIVQAFKQMGLDNLVGGQITRVQEKLNGLNEDFNRLQDELAETRFAGQSTETIEKQMIENRNEVIKLDTELVRLRRDLRGTGDIGNQITTAIGNGFKNLRTQVAGFALGFVGVSALFNKIQTFASGAVTEFEQADVSVSRFSASLANAGRENELQELSALVEELAQKFQFLDNDAIRNATDQLIVYGKVSKEQIKQLLPVIIDFATRQRISLEQATSTIIKGLEGNARAFKEFGLELKSGKDEAENFGIIVDDLGKRIEGTAEDFTKLTSGALAKNKQQWRDLQEELGKRVVPAMVAIGTAILFLVTNLPTIITLVGILAVGWGVANAQLVLTNAQLLYYNLLIVRNYIALGILSAVQLGYNTVLLAFNGVLKIVTAGLRLFGLTATAASGPLGIILTIVALLGTAVLGLSKAMGNAASAIDKNTIKLRLMADLQREAAKSTLEQRLQAEQLVKVVNDLTLSEETRNKALQKLIDIDPIFQKSLVDGKINYDKLNESLKEYNKNLLESATLQAAQTKAQAENQELQRLINVRTQFEERKAGLRARDFSDLTEEEIDFLPQGVGSTRSIRGTASLFNIDISSKEINTAISNINKAIGAQQKLAEVSKETATKLLADSFKTKGDGKNQLTAFDRFKQLLKQGGTEKEFKQLNDDIETQKASLNIFSKEYKSLQALQKEIDNLINPKEKSVKENRGSRLSGDQKDSFKDLDAVRDKELADIKIRFQQRQVAEENYLLTVLRINRDAIDAKLKLLKGSNAEERKQIAELNLEKVTLEQDTNNKIFDIRAKTLKDQLDQEIANIQLRAAAAENDPTLSNTARAQIKLDSDKQILALQEKFNADIDKLEKDQKQNSLTNTKESADAIRKTKEEILQDEKAIAEAQLKDISDAGEKQRSEISINYEKLRQHIIDNDKLTAKRRKEALERLDKLQNVTVLSSELAQLTIEFKKIEELYKKGLKSEKDFLDAKAKMENKSTDLKGAKSALAVAGIDLPSESATQKILADRLSKAFGFGEGSAEEQLLGQAISESFNLATEAMNSYFDAEEQRIQDNLQIQLDRLELEKTQVQARAQSQEEIASIEKEYAAKKRKAEQAAGEQLKKTRRAEAKIALATELANIAVSAAANPANAVTFGAAGVIMYGILAGLAFGRYALRVAEINSQKFAFGGKPGEVPVRGGEFGGKPHGRGGTDFSFKGKTYNAEVDELAVIRTKGAPKGRKFKVEGTQMEIASAINRIGGGIDFKPGAKIRKFDTGGIPGGVLQPPVFNPSSTAMFVNSGVSEEKFDELIDKITEMNDATNGRIDRLQVEQVTSTVTNAQKKQVKQSQIGTL